MALYAPKHVTFWPGGFWKQYQEESSCVHSSLVRGKNSNFGTVSIKVIAL
jgi:hypothetical protein